MSTRGYSNAIGHIFRCPSCGAVLKGWPPSSICGACGRKIPRKGGVLIFTDEPDLKLEGEGSYIGYDQVADSYAQHLYPEELDRQIWAGYGKAIAKLVGPGRVVLDLGCGPGKCALEIAKRGCRVIAGDISLNMLTILSSTLDQAPENSLVLCRLNAYDLPFLDGSLDAVVARYLLLAVGNPERVVMEVKRVLKPGGMLITEGPTERSPTDDIVSEVEMKARRYYDEALRRRGVDELKAPGWTERQMRENLPKFFRSFKLVESDDLVFRFTETPGWFLRRLGSRYSLFQVGLDQGLHEEAMDEVRRRLEEEYGKGFEEMGQEYREVHRLGVYMS